MENAKRKRLKIVALICSLVCLISACAVGTLAATSVEVKGEMEKDVDGGAGINSAFSAYKVQDTVRKTDSIVGGDIQYTVYYDTTKGAIKTKYEGTPVIIYVVNTPTVRTGTDTNAKIIKSMLDRGYPVVVLDYLNNSKAVGEALGKSTQQFRTDLRSQKILTNKTYFPTGDIAENFLAPSGCNVLLNEVFWEIDKHSASGSLEKIVENWNSDFRKAKGNQKVYWLHADGSPKATQNDFDGNSPVWYTDSACSVKATGADNNGDGVPDDAKYTFVKFTKAQTITDCVDPDGSFIDMNLYINIVYPTSPKNEVPVYILANSSGYPTSSVTSADYRPHSNHSLFTGYANVVFDYLWEPMARSASWGYYDGSQGITQDHMNYSIMIYNDKLVNTAAMRYLRLLSANGGNTYKFDSDAFAVYGNSKGGWFSFLGEADVQKPLAEGSYANLDAKLEAIDKALAAFTPDRYFEGHHGETRYQAKEGVITGDGFTLKAGERQPWLTYSDGTEIISGAQLTNACNGSEEEDITAGHAPIFISGNMTDTYNAAYSYSVNIYNLCRTLNIPLLHFEVPIGHTLTSGMDMNYNVDTFDAYWRYLNFFLKKGEISVAYMSPMNKDGDVAVTDKIEIHFAGTAALSEVEKITVKSASGTAVTGRWDSSFGGTVWTFTPDALVGSTEYTVTVPQGFKGTNGVATSCAYTSKFYTEFDKATAVTETKAASGTYYSFTAPALTSGNTFVLRFNVENDAANRAEVYAVESTSATEGTLLGNVALRGEGSYEIDVTDYVAANTGKAVTLLLKAGKTAGNTVVKSDAFDTTLPTKKTYATLSNETVAGKTGVKVVIDGVVKKDVSHYYDNVTNVFSYAKITGGSIVSPSDLGRKYTISVDIYDTISRTVHFRLNSMTKRVDFGTIDYNHTWESVETVAGQWKTYTFEYVVYESDYGKASLTGSQSLAVYASPDGNTHSPLYFDNLSVTEHVTEMTVKSATLAEKNDGTGEYVAPTNTAKPFALYNGSTLVGEYTTYKSAFESYKAGYTLTLRSDYTFTDSDLTDKMGGFGTVNIDLGGYTLTMANTQKSLVHVKATNTQKTNVNVSGGAILVGRTPIVSYDDSSYSGNGKEIYINFDGVYVGFAKSAMTTEVASAITAADGISIKSSVTFNNCNFEFKTENHAKDAIIVFPQSASGKLNVSYKVIGGSIKMDSERWITISDNAAKVSYEPGSAGYTKLYMPESNTLPVSGSYLLADGYGGFVKGAAKSGMVEYNLVKPANSTLYGVITEGYENYTFLVFQNGNLVSGHNLLKEAVVKATSLLPATVSDNAQVEILMTKDYKNTGDESNFGLNRGTIVLDLGGHTITRDKPLFNVMVNADSSASFVSNLVVKNGTALTNTGVLGETHSSSYAVVVDKINNVTFEKVTLGFVSTSTKASGNFFWEVWHNAKGEDFNAITNITLNDCVIDISHSTLTSVTVFSLDNAKYDFNVEINGGSIKCGNGTPTLYKTDSGDKFTIGTGSDGKYPTLTSVGSAYVTQSLLCEDGRYRRYENTSSGYSLVADDLVTPYGTIDSQYKDVEAYPFAIFDEKGEPIKYNNGTTVINGVSTEFYGVQTAGSAISMAKDYMKGNVWDAENNTYGSSPKKAYIVLRRDYKLRADEKYDNLAQFQGEVVIDLNGYSLIQENDKVLFPSTSKGWSGSGDALVFSKTIKIINGNIKVKSRSVVDFGVSNSEGIGGITFAYEFENVTFGLVSGSANPQNLILSTQTGSANSTCSVKLTNCKIDLKTVAPSSNMTVFNLSSSVFKTLVTVEGGVVVADDLSKVTFDSVNTTAGSSVTYTKGSGGEYLSLEYPSAQTLYAKKVGDMYFVELEDDGAVSTSYLRALSTTFGTVADSVIADHPEYLSAVDYPFFIFEENTFKSVAINWVKAVEAVKNLVKGSASAGKVAGLYMRRDYTTTQADADGKMYNFSADIGGHAILDLGGNTLTRDVAYVLDISAKAMNGELFLTKITLRNGTLVANKQAIGIGCEATAVSGSLKKAYEINLENITVKVGASIASSQVLVATWDDKSGETDVAINLKDCVLDFSNANVDKKLGNVMISSGDAKKNNIDITVTISGGKIIANDISKVSVYTLNADDVAYVAEGSDGKYPILVQSSDAAAPSVQFVTASGASISFGNGKTAGSLTTYEMGTDVATKYGSIPFVYANGEEYPFVLFDNGGKFVGAYKIWADTVDGTKLDVIQPAKDAASAGKTATILMRADYRVNGDSFNNLSQIKGTVVFDLDGHTFYATRNMLDATGKAQSGAVNDSAMVIKNGNIVLTSSLLVLSHINTLTTSLPEKTFNFTFENVNFRNADGANPSMPLIQSKNGEGCKMNANVTFTDCVFDFSTLSAASTLFELANATEDDVHVNLTVNGGEFKFGGFASAGGLVTLVHSSANDTVKFGKSQNGYSVFVLDSVEGAPELTTVLDGAATLDATTDGSYVVTPKSVQDFALKTSATLYSDLIFNVYVPNHALLKSFTVGDNTYSKDNNGLEVVNVDGKDYFKVSLYRSAAKSADSVTVSATFTLASGDTSGCWTLSLLTYGESALGNEAITTVEKQLVKDMLFYVRSAYEYFTEQNDSARIKEVVDSIDAIIGDSYGSTCAPDLSKAPLTPDANAGIVGASFDLDSTPSFVFTLDSGVNASDFTFRQGDKVLEKTVKNGYIVITSYAFRLAGDITFEGKNAAGEAVSGSYNIESYIAWVTDADNAEATAELVTLAKSFMKYCQSAEAYRSSVVDSE